MASLSAVKKLRKSKSVCATDTECGKKVGKWLDECDSDDDITEDGSVFSDDSDGDYVPPSQNKNDNDLEVTSDSSETSENASDNEVMDNGQFSDTSDCFLGRNGTVWSKTPAQRGRVASHNILRNAPGPARDVSTTNPCDAFFVFLSPNILSEILHCSNLEDRRANAGRRHWKDITIEELHAFIGIVIHAGMEKSWDVSVREMFLDPCSNPFYRASMSVGRFETIRRHLRFDDKRTRDERLKTDTLAAFSYVWKLFIDNCKKSLIPEAFLTIDEQLVPFRGRCRFLQYIPKKPAKYGIKINWLCESHTGYAIDGIIYSGKPAGGPPQKNLATNIVLKLAETVYDSARNISMDNYFTSLSLAEQLLSKKLTVVGTLRMNKPEIPIQFLANKGREVLSSEFAFKDYTTLVSYVPKKNKAVVLLSTMHHDKSIDSQSPKKKPEIILQYNKTKGGVDLMDQKVRTYTTKRITKRWPLVLYYNMLDIAALNAEILYSKQHPDYHSGISHKKRLFLKELSLELVKPHMLQRVNFPQIKKPLLESLRIFKVIPERERRNEKDGAEPAMKKRCHICPSKISRKTTMRCVKCNKTICKEHSNLVCVTCEND